MSQETASSQESASERPLTTSVEKLRHELDRWLDVAWTQGERALDVIGLREGGQGWTPRIDVIETADDVRVVVNLPGIDPATIDISLTGNMLTIQGERPALETAEEDTVHLQERPSGEFTRSIPLPVSANSDEVSAEASSGVLQITIAKTEAAKPKKIQVKAERKSTKSSAKPK